MTWKCPECSSRMHTIETRNGENGMGRFVRRRQKCHECGHKLSTREFTDHDIQKAAEKVVRLEKAIARYQDELWEAGIL